MTPEQITEALDEIISNIADAHILIGRLEKSFEAAAKANQSVDVVYADIWGDAGLGRLRKSLRIWESQLVRFENIEMPEHFERLRAGAA